MIHVSILVPEGNCSLTNIEGTQQILMRVNGYLEDAGRDALFDVHLVGHLKQVNMKNGMFMVCPDQLIGEVARTALIIIPSVHGDKQKIVADNHALLSWIVEQYKGGAAIASLCIGAFLLAGTGLLDGKSCTTHWEMADDFRKLYPAVHLLEEKIITDNDNIYTVEAHIPG
ncbi:MAG TPA: DJ-1/PfpI family protein [Puia sp.]|jgi:transcriptional regulator GlxA family with amidase domain|nr:DJ-1/PfpI family protein [Puia sp.]